MLKGKTIIELTNVETGEVERHEDDNIVTNALNKVFEPIGIFKNSGMFSGTGVLRGAHSNGSIIPYYKSLTGGVLLFDKKIPEDANTLYAPAGTNMVGCGAYGEQNSSDEICRGNFNVDESSYDASGGTIKYVYDFPTSKGNGTINCVCLTSKQGGLCGYGADDIQPRYDENNSYLVSPTLYLSTYITEDSSEYMFMIDIDNDIVYTFRITTTKIITIVKHPLFLHSISIFDNPQDTSKRTIESRQLDELTKGILNSSYFKYIVDLDAEELYIISAESYSVQANKEINIITINLKDMSISEKAITNYTTVSLYTSYSCVYKNFLYARTYDSPYSWYKIDIDNPETVVNMEIPKPNSSVDLSSSAPIGIVNGRIYCQQSRYSNDFRYQDTHCYIIDTVSNKITLPEVHDFFGDQQYGSAAFKQVKGRPWMYAVRDGSDNTNKSSSTFQMLNNYLATINNLSAPITKTDKQTMKVTYILQKDPPVSE